jgi:hypothetical protein
MSGTAMLLPLTAVADSRVQSGAPRAAVSAAAHLDFKIVIPQVLSLRVAESGGPGRITVVSNVRPLTGTVRQAQCSPVAAPADNPRPVICTVSMP